MTKRRSIRTRSFSVTGLGVVPSTTTNALLRGASWETEIAQSAFSLFGEVINLPHNHNRYNYQDISNLPL